MSSNPYELRAGLLGQAEGILTHKYHAENERLRYLCDTGKIDAGKVTWPEPPTSEEILVEAEKLYSFVQKK